MAPRRRKAVLLAALAALAVALLGALSTELGPWYRSLQQPAWKPPDALFGPAWTLIYALAAMAGIKAWEAAPDRTARQWILALFALNALLNVLWSLLFFRLQRPDWALVEVGFLWASILLLMVVLGRWSRAAAWLLLPYLLWVSLAATLNLAVVRLNGPFAP
ncbi:TspO/MBR family protein [Rivibacter subsaxonicus]|uniref:TspO/MBR related protein n=1 Tax=Rivibacter subsaxonicus TaxID=457575 RepID=A0A4Q7W1J5_9BURK|nr:TspO/MBR family protein [Rivibacter subsaxonicus]RZU02883.1 TspO/MBR related protein [Rivibacter subsaxonicus]